MAIIVIGGSNRGVGKTALVCGLIAALPEYRWTAVKITTHDHPQPVMPGRTGPFEGPPQRSHALRATSFRYFWERKPAATEARPEPAPAAAPIWEETAAGQETDTARFLAAGAARSLLVTAPDGDLSTALNQLWPRFGRGTNIIFESNSVIHHVRADACLLIHGVAERALPLPERKPSFVAAVRHADAMVAHARADKVIPDGLCLAEPESAADQQLATKPIFHLASLERISPELVAWLRRKLEPSPHF
jgi:hypothetical protein